MTEVPGYWWTKVPRYCQVQAEVPTLWKLIGTVRLRDLLKAATEFREFKRLQQRQRLYSWSSRVATAEAEAAELL